MASWRKINEVGGTVVLRIVSGLFATLAMYGFARILIDGKMSFDKAALLVGFIALMGGYAAFGNRLGPGK